MSTNQPSTTNQTYSQMDSPAQPRTFGQNLREARRQAGVSQDDLARESGVDRTAISTYERGRREPNLRTVVKLARALGVSPATLLRDLG